MDTRRDYTEEAITAARTVLVEALEILSEYRDGILVIGGWVPELLIGGHPGTTDVDLGLEPGVLRDSGYARICRSLLARGYERDSNPEEPHRLHRALPGGRSIPLDFITTEEASAAYQQAHDGDGPGHAHGLELAFELNEEVRVHGRAASGEPETVPVRVAGILPLMVMKAAAFGGRKAAKDAYDLYFCIRNYPGGVEALAESVRPYRSRALVREMLARLSGQFASPESAGPRAVVEFEEVVDPDEQDRIGRAAHEHVQALLGQVSARQ